jgi:archaellum component FlaC
MPLKKCQDEKKIVEDALENSQKEVERLKKTHEDDIKLIENLCQDSKVFNRRL